MAYTDYDDTLPDYDIPRSHSQSSQNSSSSGSSSPPLPVTPSLPSHYSLATAITNSGSGMYDKPRSGVGGTGTGGGGGVGGKVFGYQKKLLERTGSISSIHSINSLSSNQGMNPTGNGRSFLSSPSGYSLARSPSLRSPNPSSTYSFPSTHPSTLNDSPATIPKPTTADGLGLDGPTTASAVPRSNPPSPRKFTRSTTTLAGDDTITLTSSSTNGTTREFTPTHRLGGRNGVASQSFDAVRSRFNGLSSPSSSSPNGGTTPTSGNTPTTANANVNANGANDGFAKFRTFKERLAEKEREGKHLRDLASTPTPASVSATTTNTTATRPLSVRTDFHTNVSSAVSSPVSATSRLDPTFLPPSTVSSPLAGGIVNASDRENSRSTNYQTPIRSVSPLSFPSTSTTLSSTSDLPLPVPRHPPPPLTLSSHPTSPIFPNAPITPSAIHSQAGHSRTRHGSSLSNLGGLEKSTVGSVRGLREFLGSGSGGVGGVGAGEGNGEGVGRKRWSHKRAQTLPRLGIEGGSESGMGTGSDPSNPSGYLSPTTTTTDGDASERMYGHARGLDRLSEVSNPGAASSFEDDGVRSVDNKRAEEIVIPGITSGAEDVTGMHGRIRLSRALSIGPSSTLSSSSKGTGSSISHLSNGTGGSAIGGAGAGSGLSGTGMGMLGSSLKQMETQRHLLQAYEYLCHVAEAKEWLDACLETAEPLSGVEGTGTGETVIEMETRLRDGIALARLARVFEGEEWVPKIITDVYRPRREFLRTDNIVCFIKFAERAGLPSTFIFETNDLYAGKNLPKVIYCIHALSHLFARRGIAERIGNLVGKLDFEDSALQQKQRDLDAAGVAMPNFGNIGTALAKGLKEEPEPEPETEDQRRTRLLAEAEPDIVACQAQVRAAVARRSHQTKVARLARADASTTALQATCRGALARQRFDRAINLKRDVDVWATKIQTACRSALARRAWNERQDDIDGCAWMIPRVQAQIRGVLVRWRHARLRRDIARSERCVVGLQSSVRAKLARSSHQQTTKFFEQGHNVAAVQKIQAAVRGTLVRRRFFNDIQKLDNHEATIVSFQAAARGALARSRYEDLVYRLSEAVLDVIALQAQVRGVLTRRALLKRIRALRSAESSATAIQSRIRGVMARKVFASMSRDLKKVEVTKSVGGLQAFARAALARKKHETQKKELDFTMPDIIGFQAAARGYLARRNYWPWRNHLWNSQPAATHLQSLIRGLLARRTHHQRLQHYQSNLEKVVKVQAVFRAKQQGDQYRQLTMGKNIPLGTVKNFVHCLTDSDYDFEEEMEVERLRKEVVKNIRENQNLEVSKDELDTKIALLVKNKITLDEVSRVRRTFGARVAGHNRNSILASANDPFALVTLDQATRRKLELYQEMFYLLQTRPEYLARLFRSLERIDMTEKAKKTVENVVMTLYGYAQNPREEFLLLKLFQRSIHEELAAVTTIQEFIRGNYIYIKLVTQYGRSGKEKKYLCDTLGPLVRSIIQDEGLNLETDPVEIYKASVNAEETRTGLVSRRPRNVERADALGDPETRQIFISRLQQLRHATDVFLKAVIESTRRMPYGLRYVAREIFRALQVKFPDEPQDAIIRVVCHFVYYRYLNPVIFAPEQFDVVDGVVQPYQRKNLGEISKMLNQISVGRLFLVDKDPFLQPLNEYVMWGSAKLSEWLYQVIDVPDAEIYFKADEYLDHTVAQRPVIYISPLEIYSTHSLILQHADTVAPGQEDPLRSHLVELGGAPPAASEELDRARSGEIALNLTNKTADLRDPRAEEKALFVKTKRYVLLLLKVQTGKDLVDAFIQPVLPEHEEAWQRVVATELSTARHRKPLPRSPSSPELGVHLDEVRNLPFSELKARTIEHVLELEKSGKVTRSNAYQDILDSLALDIKIKHRRRIERQNQIANMNTTLSNLTEKQKYLQEQLKLHSDYIDAAQATIQRKGGKKRLVLPFSSQYFHQRELARSGKKAQYGSYKYTAQKLHEKGVLLSIDQFSDRQFDKISLTISSDEIGVFEIEAKYNGIPVPDGTIVLRMEDLLQLQFSNTQTLDLNSIAKVNLNLLLHLINQKFYV